VLHSRQSIPWKANWFQQKARNGGTLFSEESQVPSAKLW
jgi:hypothetical protein